MGRISSPFGQFERGQIYEMGPGLFSIAIVYTAVLIPTLLVIGASLLIFANSFTELLPDPSGCTLFGLYDSRDEEALDLASTRTDSNLPNVKSLWIYPIKSCRGIKLPDDKVVPTGFKYDRQFCFAELISPFPVSARDSKSKKADHKWRFITQREFPLLARVKTELWLPNPKKLTYSRDLLDVRTEGAIIVTYPYQEDGFKGWLAGLAAKLRWDVPEKSFKIPFKPTREQMEIDFTMEDVTVWRDSPKSINMQALVPPELKYFLGVRNPLTLFRVGQQREVYRNAPRKEELGWQPVTGFADAFPINLIGEASIHEISGKQPETVAALDETRFRPNIVVRGTPAYDEDSWKKIRIGQYEYHVISRCVRCRVPNVDPKSGVKDRNEPFKTIKRERSIDRGAPGMGCMGMSMVPVLQESKIQVGDEVEVLERGEHKYIHQ